MQYKLFFSFPRQSHLATMNSKFQALLAHIEHFQSYPLLQHYEIIRKEEEEWVTIGGEESFLLEGPMQQPDGDHRMVLQSSSAPMDDQQVIPIWFTFQQFWFPYIPNGFHHYLVSSNIPSSWMHLGLEESEDIEGPINPFRLNGELLYEIYQDFELADELLMLLDDSGGFRKSMVCTIHNIVKLFCVKGRRQSRIFLTEARSHMLSLLGAISYCLHHTDSTRYTAAINAYEEQLRTWLILDAPKVGTLLDILNPPNDTVLPIGDLLKHQVPIYYPWSEHHRATILNQQSHLSSMPLTADDFRNQMDSLLAETTLPASTITPHAEQEYQGLRLRLTTSQTAFHNDTRVLWDEIAALSAATLLGLAAIAMPPVRTFHAGSWNNSALSHCMFFTHQLAETILRDILLHRKCRNVADLLLEAIERGMGISLGYATEYLIEQQSHRAIEPPPLPLYFQANYVELPLVFHDSIRQQSWGAYLHNVKQVLARPHASSFLLQGGILWRIALEFGPTNLLPDLLQGPSVTMVECLYGQRNVNGHLFEGPTDGELAVLLGEVAEQGNMPKKSWWPSPSCFERNKFFVAQWTSLHEAWFQARLANITQGRIEAVPQTLHQFDKELERYGRQLQEEVAIPEVMDVLLLREGLELYLGKWQGAILSTWKVYA